MLSRKKNRLECVTMSDGLHEPPNRNLDAFSSPLEEEHLPPNSYNDCRRFEASYDLHDWDGTEIFGSEEYSNLELHLPALDVANLLDENTTPGFSTTREDDLKWQNTFPQINSLPDSGIGSLVVGYPLQCFYVAASDSFPGYTTGRV